MPSIDEVSKKGFKKTSHRPWDGMESFISTPKSSKTDVKPEKETAVIKDSHVELSNNTAVKFESANLNDETIIEISPDKIFKWEHKDRPENELGDIEDLARTLKEIGQLQPGIVRKVSKNGFEYELLIGERRWLACKRAGISFRARLVNFDDTEAGLAQAVENEGREKLSDYARGMSYAKKIAAGIFKQKDLIEKLGKSKQEISRLLSYKDIPNQLIEAIGDMRKVSPYTAETLKQLCNKDPENLKILIGYADKIADGQGNTSIERYVDNAKTNFINTERVFSDDNRHLFSLRKDSNGNPSISFPKDIRETIDQKSLMECIKFEIEKQLKTKVSPVNGTS